jgi:cytoskeleton protein RodZ
VFNRTMRAGETWPVPNKSGLLLTVGNAGGTEVLIDGIATASLGADGAVRRDLPLDLDQVQNGKLAAAAIPAPKPAAPKQP